MYRGFLRWTLCVAGLAAAAICSAASFDCRRPASHAERAICADRELSQLDERLAFAYKRFMSTSAQPYEDQRQQQRWLAERDGCRDTACIREKYTLRLTELRVRSSDWLTWRADNGTWAPSESGDSVCAAARSQMEAVGLADFVARSPEQALGIVCGSAGRACPAGASLPIEQLSRLGLSPDAQPLQGMLAQESAVQASRVDIDNDGVADLRFAQRVGPAECERSYFFLGSAQGYREPAGEGYDRLRQDNRLCGRERLSFHRHRDVNYTLEIGEQAVHIWRGAAGNGLQPLCGFKRRWTEQEKRAAYAVLKRHPDILRNATILRPEKDKTASGRRVWAVQIRCASGSLHAEFYVDPRTLSAQVVIAPGSERSERCDSQRVAAQPVSPVPSQLAMQEPVLAGPWLHWQGIP
jgi:uncharacterized protein